MSAATSRGPRLDLLLKLARLLERLPTKRFYFGSWVGQDWRGARDLSCGTTACALGWATTLPELRGRLALLLPKDSRTAVVTWDRRSGRRHEIGVRAGARAFRIPERVAAALFIPYEHSSVLGALGPASDAGPADVAGWIRLHVTALRAEARVRAKRAAAKGARR